MSSRASSSARAAQIIQLRPAASNMAPAHGESLMLSSARPLVEAGFAIHWLRPRSKAPAEAGWSTLPTASYAEIAASYRRDANLGVRLGEPSATPAGYLHVFDIDIRVAELADEAWAAFATLFPDIDPAALPSVASGSGGESRHLYFVSERPFASKLLAVSEGKHRREKVDPKTGELKSGWSCDWEIELFGTGKQVVLPPSIHPDTRKPYAWEREFNLAALDIGIGPEIPAAQIEALGVTNHTTYAFESREPLEFKAGQIERELDELAISDFVYDDWIRLGQALHHQFGAAEAGWDLWLQHTRRSTKYDGDDRTMRKKWRSFGRYRGQPVTMATVRHWVQEARIAGLTDAFEDLDDEGDTTSLGQTEDGLIDIDALLGGPETPSTPIAGNWHRRLDVGTKGQIRPTLHNVSLILANDKRLADLLGFDEFTQEILLRKAPGHPTTLDRASLQGIAWKIPSGSRGVRWNDSHDAAVRALLSAPTRQGGYGVQTTKGDLKAAADIVAGRNSFHPVRDYLSGLSWDGVSRVETLFIDYLGAEENAYHREIAHVTLVAAVARVFEPGHKFDFVSILEGKQGIRKSTFVKTLARRWYTELTVDFGDAQKLVEGLQGAWIVEIAELQSFRRTEITALKGAVSRQTDTVRLAWDARARDFHRQCVFFGSTNDRSYLRDETGGRRFWPIECRTGTIETDRLSSEVDQIWAEALCAYRQMRQDKPAGDLPLYLRDPDSCRIALELQDSRRIETVADGLVGEIAAWLESPIGADLEGTDPDSVKYRTETCCMEIWTALMGKDRHAYPRASQLELSRAMDRVPGWRKTSSPRKFGHLGLQRTYVREDESDAR